MSILFWGLTLSVAGKILLGVAVILVHNKVIHAHKIDRSVLREMRRERNVALLGVVLILVGYLMELTHHGFIIV